MRIIILGGTGLLGHTLWEYFSLKYPDTFTTVRLARTTYENHKIYKNDKVIDNVDITDIENVEKILNKIKPDIILNCIGVTKRRENIDNYQYLSILLNALFPIRLSQWAKKNNSKVINFSTDCVFDGKIGNYSEDSPTNATDVYGKTKSLGEIRDDNALTLRSSFIGFELYHKTELLEWFLSQKVTVKGFKNAIYSGLTTLELSRVVENILLSYPKMTGLYNISSESINKYDLLMLIRKKFKLVTKIIPDETFSCDRSLNSSKFRKELNYNPPSWESMIAELSEKYLQKKDV